MRSLKTLVGFVLILGLLTLGVVGLDYLAAPVTLKLAFALLLGAFGLIAFGTAILARPTAGTVLATAAAVIALFVAIRGVFVATLDLVLFALIIFDVIVLFVLFGEIDRFDRRRRAVLAHKAGAPVRSTPVEPVEHKRVAAQPAVKKPVAKKAAAQKPVAKPVKKAAVKKPAKKRTSAAVRPVAQFVAIKDREDASFHTINCYIAQRIPQDERTYSVTREEALKKGHKPCRVCNP